jgi:hypothetical protein
VDVRLIMPEESVVVARLEEERATGDTHAVIP